MQIGDSSKVEANAIFGDDVVLGRNVKIKVGVVNDGITVKVNVPDATIASWSGVTWSRRATTRRKYTLVEGS